MAPEANPVWRGDWAARICDALSQRGFASLADLLKAFPADTYFQLAE